MKAQTEAVRTRDCGVKGPGLVMGLTANLAEGETGLRPEKAPHEHRLEGESESGSSALCPSPGLFRAASSVCVCVVCVGVGVCVSVPHCTLHTANRLGPGHRRRLRGM